MKTWCVLLTAIALLASCRQQTPGDSEKSVEEIMKEGVLSNADIIRNPVSADTPQDTVNVAEMTFEQEVHDFGEVEEGAVVEHVFTFANTGKVPLVISGARSTCGCTVPEWPRDPVPPGEQGEILVRFNTKNKRSQQSKPITITANTYPSTNKVLLTGIVRPSEEADQ